MTCNLAIAAALFFSPDLPVVQPADATASPAIHAASALTETDFNRLVEDSRKLKSIVDGWMAADTKDEPDFIQSQAYLSFKADTQALAVANMQAHLQLKSLGTDGDLTCILRGIAEDLPLKLGQIETASAGQARLQALDEMAYLLNDNAEVILAPPVAY